MIRAWHAFLKYILFVCDNKMDSMMQRYYRSMKQHFTRVLVLAECKGTTSILEKSSSLYDRFGLVYYQLRYILVTSETF